MSFDCDTELFSLLGRESRGSDNDRNTVAGCRFNVGDRRCRNREVDEDIGLLFVDKLVNP